MPARRELTMRQLRQMLRLHHDGVSAREIARTLGVARSTIQDNLARARTAGIGWPLPAEWTDELLEEKLFARSGVKPGRRRHSEPDWAMLMRELKRPDVNLMVLWEEYRQGHPDGYGYSRFCDLAREFERRLSPVMRQHHVAGDKVFVDYSGKKISIVDPKTGEVREAEIFVAVLGASNFTYSEATWTQTLPDWIEAHVRMFRFFGGVPRLVIPDNLKSGVHKASFYDPELNRSYGMMAAHYGVGILPARPYRPRDKAKVEAGVRFVQRRQTHIQQYSRSDLARARRESAASSLSQEASSFGSAPRNSSIFDQGTATATSRSSSVSASAAEIESVNAITARSPSSSTDTALPCLTSRYSRPVSSASSLPSMTTGSMPVVCNVSNAGSDGVSLDDTLGPRLITVAAASSEGAEK
jgi:transposase